MRIIMRGGYRQTGQQEDEAEARRRLQIALGLSAGASIPVPGAGGQRHSSTVNSNSPATAPLSHMSSASAPPADLLAASLASRAPFPSLHSPSLSSSASNPSALLGTAASSEAQLPHLAMLLQDPRGATNQGVPLEAQLLQAQAQAQAQDAELRMRVLLEQEAVQTEEQLRALRFRRQQQQLQDEVLLRAAYSEMQNPRPQAGLFDRFSANPSALSIGASAASLSRGLGAGVGAGSVLPTLSSSAFLSQETARTTRSLGFSAEGHSDRTRLALANNRMEESLTGKILQLDAEGSPDMAFQAQANGQASASAYLAARRGGQYYDTKEGEEMKAAPLKSDTRGDDVSDEEYFRTHKNPRDVKPSAEDLATNRAIKRSREPFPLKLYRILHEAEKNGQADIISFFPHGKSFTVHKPQEFIRDIMPKYFAAGRMNTFLKQLNLYSFQRITEGPDKGGYFHPEFARGKRRFHKKVKRKRTIPAKAVADQGVNEESGRQTPSATDRTEAKDGAPMSPASESSDGSEVESSGVMELPRSAVARLPNLGSSQADQDDDESMSLPRKKRGSSR